MRTHRFGRKIRLPSTIAIKHQIKMLMVRDEIARSDAEAGAELFGEQQPGKQELVVN